MCPLLIRQIFWGREPLRKIGKKRRRKKTCFPLQESHELWLVWSCVSQCGHLAPSVIWYVLMLGWLWKKTWDWIPRCPIPSAAFDTKWGNRYGYKTEGLPPGIHLKWTRDCPDCHKSIPFNPSKSYILAVSGFLGFMNSIGCICNF